MHVCMIFAPKSANNIRNQQAQRKKTVKRTMAIPGFLKAFADSHTFLYSKNGKTPNSSLFSVLLLSFFQLVFIFFKLSLEKKKKSRPSFLPAAPIVFPSHLAAPQQPTSSPLWLLQSNSLPRQSEKEKKKKEGKKEIPPSEEVYNYIKLKIIIKIKNI